MPFQGLSLYKNAGIMKSRLKSLRLPYTMCGAFYCKNGHQCFLRTTCNNGEITGHGYFTDKNRPHPHGFANRQIHSEMPDGDEKVREATAAAGLHKRFAVFIIREKFLSAVAEYPIFP